jgi:ABC-type nitrate/sulfonate/bicarbonate transport system substrate-binding protein
VKRLLPALSGVLLLAACGGGASAPSSASTPASPSPAASGKPSTATSVAPAASAGTAAASTSAAAKPGAAASGGALTGGPGLGASASTAPGAASGAATASGGAASGAAAPAPSGALTLTVALPWPAKPPVCCMEEPASQDLGFYKQQGLNVNFVNVSTASAGTIQTLVAGKADIAGAAMAAGLAGYSAGATNVRYIGSELNSTPSLNHLQWFFAGKNTIKQPADLKGKKIGVVTGANPTDPGYVQFHALLASVKLTDNDVDWVVAGTQAAREQALVAGRIDITTIPMEESYIVNQTPGLTLIYWDPVGGQTGWGGCECWFTTTDVLKDPQKKEAIQRFVNGTMLGIRDLVGSQDEFKKAESLYLDMSQQTPDSIKNTYDFEHVQYMANGGMELNLMTDWFNNVYTKSINPAAAGKFTLKDVVDPSFVSAALQKLGTDNAATWDPPQLTFPS